jgi:orotate phosphoribosyltransferase
LNREKKLSLRSNFHYNGNTMGPDDILKFFKETGALLSGHFELRSGLHSDQFFQCAKLLQYPRLAECLCNKLVDRIRPEIHESINPGAVIAPALGGLIVGHEVGRILGLKFLFAEKEDGGLVLRRGFQIEPDHRLIVAEDVVTRGGRVQQTIDLVRERGGIVDAVLVLVDRSGGKASFDVPMHSLVQMEPMTWTPSECPLCAKGEPLEHPGS